MWRVDQVVVDGVRLEAGWWQPAEPAAGGAPLVLLHEGLGSVSTWRDFPARLAARTGRGVFAYSRRGHGRSEPRGTGLAMRFMHDEAAVLPRVLDAAGITRAVLVGHSDGGSIALLAAAAIPDRVAALVVEAPHVFVEERSIASIRAIRDRYAGDAQLRARLAAHHRHVDEMFYGWNDVWLDDDFRAWTIGDEIRRVTCPVLALQGLEDEYGTPAHVQAIQRLAAGPVTLSLIQKCGHSPHRDHPEIVLDRVAAFIAQPHG
jgi:pimeloyl-ACP methyl ester carboxylesterase